MFRSGGAGFRIRRFLSEISSGNNGPRIRRLAERLPGLREDLLERLEAMEPTTVAALPAPDTAEVDQGVANSVVVRDMARPRR